MWLTGKTLILEYYSSLFNNNNTISYCNTIYMYIYMYIYIYIFYLLILYYLCYCHV